MRFLKNKILRAQTYKKESKNEPYALNVKIESDLEAQVKAEHMSLSSQTTLTSSLHKVETVPKVRKQTSALYRSTKNIALNYGKAIIAFACSDLATPYLEHLSSSQQPIIVQFRDFAQKQKIHIRGISTFRSLFLIDENDDRNVVLYKKMFKWIGEVFIKYFSANWILTGKVSHKLTYLKFRCKMLRRIQNPESFTCIRERKTKKPKKTAQV